MTWAPRPLQGLLLAVAVLLVLFGGPLAHAWGSPESPSASFASPVGTATTTLGAIAGNAASRPVKGGLTDIGPSGPDSPEAKRRVEAVASSDVFSAPRALPAARQVEAAWGPARRYAHGPGRMTAIEHINYRHAFNSGFNDVSRFAQGTGPRQIRGYVDEALRHGNVTQGGTSIRHNLGRVIGYDQAGNPVSGIQVWVRDGYIRTAYPVAP